MKKILLMVAALLPLGLLCAQTNENNNTTEERIHELSINLTQLLNNSTGTNWLYRNHRGNKALRIEGYLDLGGALADLGSEGAIFDRSDVNANISAFIGYEFRRPLREFQYYYGADFFIGYGFQNSNDGRLIQQQGNPVVQLNTRSVRHSYTAGVRPFLGLAYRINNIFSLGCEIRSIFSFNIFNHIAISERGELDPITGVFEFDPAVTSNQVSSSLILRPVALNTSNLKIWLSVHL